MSVDEIVKTYGAAWLELDADRRHELLLQAWADDGTYTDPLQHLEGRDALNQRIAAFQRQRPGERIVLISGVDQHHDMVRFAWRWYGPDGSTIMDGVDFGELASDGRLHRIVGFFGPIPAL
jgi:SnoaL-like protein